MTPDAYRKKVLRDLDRAHAKKTSATGFRDTSKSATKRLAELGKLGVLEHADDLAAARALASDDDAQPALRAAAIAKLGPALADDAALVTTLIDLVGSEAPIAVRTAALQVLRAADFHFAGFRTNRPRYLDALRTASTADDTNLRLRALGVLAREKDARTQRKLVDGLRDPKKALVKPDKALQLLAYDTKGDWQDVVTEYADARGEAPERLQALRILAADASNEPRFEKILKDRKEPVAARRIALAALHAMQSTTLAGAAARVVGDAKESEELRQACLVAASLGKPNAELEASARKLHRTAKSKGMRNAARQYLDKASRRGE